MNAEELEFYLYMEHEELKDKEELTNDDKVNLEINPFGVLGVPTKDK